MDFTKPEAQTFLKEALTDGTMLVTFTKKDGTERKMRCTLQEAYKQEPKESTSTRSVPTTSLAVYDLDVQGWRSFRWDSILSVSSN